jgi:hypothetical protein
LPINARNIRLTSCEFDSAWRASSPEYPSSIVSSSWCWSSLADPAAMERRRAASGSVDLPLASAMLDATDTAALRSWAARPNRSVRGKSDVSW